MKFLIFAALALLAVAPRHRHRRGNKRWSKPTPPAPVEDAPAAEAQPVFESSVYYDDESADLAEYEEEEDFAGVEDVEEEEDFADVEDVEDDEE